VATSWLVLTMKPYCAKPKDASNRWVIFSTVWFLTTSMVSLIVGLILGIPRIFLDVLFVNFTLYTWFQHMIIPEYKKREVRGYVKELMREWKQEMG